VGITLSIMSSSLAQTVLNALEGKSEQHTSIDLQKAHTRLKNLQLREKGLTTRLQEVATDLQNTKKNISITENEIREILASLERKRKRVEVDEVEYDDIKRHRAHVNSGGVIVFTTQEQLDHVNDILRREKKERDSQQNFTFTQTPQYQPTPQEDLIFFDEMDTSQQ